MSKPLELINIGATVYIDPGGKIEGTVLAIAIREYSYGVQYEVAWWKDGDRKSAWFESFLIRQKNYNDPPYLKIGFQK